MGIGDWAQSLVPKYINNIIFIILINDILIMKIKINKII